MSSGVTNDASISIWVNSSCRSARKSWTSQVIVSMGHPQIFVVRVGVNRERQIVRPIQNFQFARNDFDIAGGEVRIVRAGQPRSDLTGHLNDVFAAQCMRLLCKLGIFLRPKHDLRQAFAIAEINENYTAVIACDIYPTGERDLPADVCLAK